MGETQGQDSSTVRLVIYTDQGKENATRNTGVREGGRIGRITSKDEEKLPTQAPTHLNEGLLSSCSSSLAEGLQLGPYSYIIKPTLAAWDHLSPSNKSSSCALPHFPRPESSSRVLH